MTSLTLVIATVGRVDELERLLGSLAYQGVAKLQIVVVDQNPDDRLRAVMVNFRAGAPHGWDIVHKQVDWRGLSRARNDGLALAQGEVIGFPDDDCWYPPGTLSHAATLLGQDGSLKALVGRLIDESGDSKCFGVPREQSGQRVKRKNAFYGHNTNTFFLRRSVLGSLVFDETLGPGSGTPAVCGEDGAFLVDLIDRGVEVEYRPELQIVHPNPLSDRSKVLSRGRGYGFGLLWAMRSRRMPLSVIVPRLIRPIGGIVIAALQRDGRQVRYYWQTLIGRWEAFVLSLNARRK